MKLKAPDWKTVYKQIKAYAGRLWRHEDELWAWIWGSGLFLLWIWNIIFLNAPAFSRLTDAFFNTFIVGILVIVFTLLMGWGSGVALHFLSRMENGRYYFAFSFLINLIRSVPQIVGILAGYVILTGMVSGGIIGWTGMQMILMALIISIFVFPELTDLIRERINYYMRKDFYNAMLCCGMDERRIINYEILWKNSLPYLFQKVISIFGISIFLQCSIDFIISVGLSTQVSLTGFPKTLGNMLARMDSKQDILAIGNLFTDPFYFSDIVTVHLQGVSIAIIIVFTLFSIYKISNGLLKRKKLF